MTERIPRDDPRAARARPLFRAQGGTVLPRASQDQLAVLERLRDHARALGYREGVEAVLKQVSERLAEAERLAASYVEAHQEDAVALGFAIAERLLQSTLEREPERLASLVEEALYGFVGENRVEIVCGEAAQAVLEEHMEALERSVEGAVVALKTEPSAAPWSVRVESSAGSLDLGLEAQLERLWSALEKG